MECLAFPTGFLRNARVGHNKWEKSHGWSTTHKQMVHFYGEKVTLHPCPSLRRQNPFLGNKLSGKFSITPSIYKKMQIFNPDRKIRKLVIDHTLPGIFNMGGWLGWENNYQRFSVCHPNWECLFPHSAWAFSCAWPSMISKKKKWLPLLPDQFYIFMCQDMHCHFSCGTKRVTFKILKKDEGKGKKRAM